MPRSPESKELEFYENHYPEDIRLLRAGFSAIEVNLITLTVPKELESMRRVLNSQGAIVNESGHY